jgi:putative phosphoribosyl transferase
VSPALRIVNEGAEEAWRCFTDREEAGRVLARSLHDYRGADTVVVGLPRGGMPVAEAVARELGADLDVLVSRKIGVPGQRELALGAVAEGGVVHWNEDVRGLLALSSDACRRELERTEAELEARVAACRAVLAPARLAGRTVIVTDDGVATGATLRAAVGAVRQAGPGRLVIALPGGSPDTLRELAGLEGVDEVVALVAPLSFYAVGQLYEDFSQVSDREVLEILRAAAERRAHFSSRGRAVEPQP